MLDSLLEFKYYFCQFSWNLVVYNFINVFMVEAELREALGH